jgi:hypothetical protein
MKFFKTKGHGYLNLDQVLQIIENSNGLIADRKKKRLAEEVRFELTEPAKVQRFSRPPDSTTLAPLRDNSF